MHLPFTTFDVFTSTRYLGNPLAIVCVPRALRSQLTESRKQAIATEFNLSEIVFLHEVPKGEDGEGEVADYDIFTARSRISFAGHPTVGTSIYIARHRNEYAGVKKLRTVAGLVEFVYSEEGGGTASVKVPHDVHIHKARLPHPLPSPDMNPTSSTTVPLVSIVKGMAFNLVPLSTLEALGSVSEGLVPVADVFACEYLDKGSGWDAGLTGTFYFVDLGCDPDSPDRQLLRTRSIGSREDPGTGSASAALCSYLALQEGVEKGRGPFEFHLVQGVEMGRRCDIFVSVVRKAGGREIEEIRLKGAAVEVMEGVIEV
ncbi:phenazine biosynthesis-like protein [Lindgomyces ingoldianus]|uniref:Phenazine biosynthesis-like protein n=1 Tax=Lindgomyces ingoldianus TaxID=673940 RepID=A0ACB6R7U3_9PLEO|nr:phenazine biosynthesis-like protein [Lindgomyces ingoldianus]KAF2475384.1 phenazine biosynthesis-like protein [Lindgomyces ingoldianus]